MAKRVATRECRVAGGSLMTARVLFVDDEPNVLEGIQRGLRKRFELHIAIGGAQGLKVLGEAGPFALIVSDMRMPEMTGAQFLARAREKCPESVRMILSGQADLEATIAAVNEGHIFRFLSKPIANEQLIAAIDAGLEQYRLITAEKVLLEQTLAGAAKMLIEILGMVSPAAYGRASRLQTHVVAMSAAIGVADRWQFPLAAMLSQIGCVSLPAEIFSRIDAGQSLGAEEQRLYDSHPEVASRLLAAIPRLEDVAAIVAGQRSAPQRLNRPSDLRQWDTRSLGQLLLCAASTFDHQVVGGVSAAVAAEQLRGPAFGLQPAVTDALRTSHSAGTGTSCRMVRLKELALGMIIDEDLKSDKGMRLVVSGQEVTASLLVRLRTISSGIGVVEPFRVRVPI
jgi:CheY-like chemotaxis protein